MNISPARKNKLIAELNKMTRQLEARLKELAKLQAEFDKWWKEVEARDAIEIKKWKKGMGR
jgi:hypothetical protein